MRPLIIIGRCIDWETVDKSPDIERWGISSAWADNPIGTECCDLIFQIHSPDRWEPGIGKIKDRLVIAWDNPGYEDCKRLPVYKLLSEFGPIFPSSINWMLAYALFMDYNDIAIKGVDMVSNGEYGFQRDGLFYMLGIAAGRGVNIKVDKTSGIYMPPMIYGVEAKE